MQLQNNVEQNSAYRPEFNLLPGAKKAFSHPSRKHWNLFRYTADFSTTAPAMDAGPSIITTYCPVMRLDISQQPVWRWDARLGEVVPPPWFLLLLYPSFTYVRLAVALELIVGVESIPRVHCGEEVVVDIRLHGSLDVGQGKG